MTDSGHSLALNGVRFYTTDDKADLARTLGRTLVTLGASQIILTVATAGSGDQYLAIDIDTEQD